MVVMASASRTVASRSTWRGVELLRAGDLAASAVDSAAEATPKPRLRDPRARVASAAASAVATSVAEMASAEDSRAAAAAAVASAVVIVVVSGVVALVVVAGIVVLGHRTATALLLTHPQVLATAAAVAATVTETATVAMVVGMTEVAAHLTTDRVDVMVEAGSATATDEAAAAAAAVLEVQMPTTSPSAEAGSTATSTDLAKTTAENAVMKEATKTPESCVGTNLAPCSRPLARMRFTPVVSAVGIFCLYTYRLCTPAQSLSDFPSPFRHQG